MKHKIGTSLFALVVCLALLPAGPAFAQLGEQKMAAIYLLSKTDATNVKDEGLAYVYKEADAELVEHVMDGLASQDIKVKFIKTEQEITPDPLQFIVIVKIENIELGRKRPFGRTAKVKVGTFFENKDRFDLVKRTYEETSAKAWQSCIDKISDLIVDDTIVDVEKYSKAAAEKQGKSK